jgi:hypothetical protein
MAPASAKERAGPTAQSRLRDLADKHGSADGHDEPPVGNGRVDGDVDDHRPTASVEHVGGGFGVHGRPTQEGTVGVVVDEGDVVDAMTARGRQGRVVGRERQVSPDGALVEELVVGDAEEGGRGLGAAERPRLAASGVYRRGGERGDGVLDGRAGLGRADEQQDERCQRGQGGHTAYERR